MLELFENKETLLIQAYKTLSLEIIRTAERTIYREHVDRTIDYIKVKDQEYFKYDSGFKEYFFEEFEFDDLEKCKTFLKEITGIKEALAINNYTNLKKNKNGTPIVLNNPEEEKIDKKSIYSERKNFWIQ